MSDDEVSSRRRATRDRLLEAAASVFAELGLQGASVEAVCSRAGFTRGAFYSNFASKEELFLALLQGELDRRRQHLEQQVEEIEPRLRQRDAPMDPAEAARYITDFFAPEGDAVAWFTLEVEFLLLAMRDPSAAPGYHEFTERFYAGVTEIVERVLEAAGRRFVLPIAHAIPVLGSVYEHTLRAAALGGPGADAAMANLGPRLAELLFALTEPTGGPAPQAPRS